MTSMLEPEVKTPARAERPGAAIVFNFVVGWVLLFAFAVAAGALFVQGSLASSHHDLAKKLEDDAWGGVTSTVEVDDAWAVGAGPREGWRGYTTVDVRWRDGWVQRDTSYVIASSERQAEAARRGSSQPVAVIVAPETLESHLSQTQPDLVLEVVEGWSGGGAVEVLGTFWAVPSWALILGFVAGLGSLTRLVVGPEPWRLTRWAWAWWVLFAWPIGVPAFLVFSGATWLFPPYEPKRRMTGAASLLLLVCLGVVGAQVFA